MTNVSKNVPQIICAGQHAKFSSLKSKKSPTKKVGFIFEKGLDFLSLPWYVARLTEKEAKPMKNLIKELWHGNIVPQEDSRTNSKEMKELIGYIARHNEDLTKLLNDEQTEIFEKYQECWNEYVSLAEAAIFEYAFKLGARLAIEVQSDTKEE